MSPYVVPEKLIRTLDEHRRELGKYGCAGSGPGMGNKAEKQHVGMVLRIAKLSGPSYMVCKRKYRTVYRKSVR